MSELNCFIELSSLQRDSLLLAAISEDSAATLETDLVDFLSTFELPPIEAQEPALEHRHLLYQTSDGSTQSYAWPDPDTSWSGSKNAAKEADVMGALLAGHRSLQSCVLHCDQADFTDDMIVSRQQTNAISAPELPNGQSRNGQTTEQTSISSCPRSSVKKVHW